MPSGSLYVKTVSESEIRFSLTIFRLHSVTLWHWDPMKTMFLSLLVLAGALMPLSLEVTGKAHAQACLGPAEQHAAIMSGQARRFGEIAAIVSKNLNGTVYNGELCRRGDRLVYILTVVKKNGTAVRTVVDAKSGR